MAEKDSDSMIRCNRDVIKQLNIIAASKGMTLKGYLKVHAEKEIKKVKV